MRQIIIIILFFFCCCGCQQNSNNRTASARSHLSVWLEENEDTLFQELSALVAEDTFALKESGGLRSNQILITRNYQPDSGMLADFLRKIKMDCECLFPSFEYNTETVHHLFISLTADFDTTCAISLDTILRDATNLKYFKIARYIPASGEFSTYIYQDEIQPDTLLPNDIKFDILPKNKKIELIIYFKKHVGEETKRSLVKTILGEEIFMKRIITVHFEDDLSGRYGDYSYSELREYFNLE
jgi:hypothetical protein